MAKSDPYRSSLSKLFTLLYDMTYETKTVGRIASSINVVDVEGLLKTIGSPAPDILLHFRILLLPISLLKQFQQTRELEDLNTLISQVTTDLADGATTLDPEFHVTLLVFNAMARKILKKSSRNGMRKNDEALRVISFTVIEHLQAPIRYGKTAKAA